MVDTLEKLKGPVAINRTKPELKLQRGCKKENIECAINRTKPELKRNNGFTYQ